MSIRRMQIIRPALLALLLGRPGFAQAQMELPPNVVVSNCSGCHELRGNAELPYIPRLAGLPASYMKARLKTFDASSGPMVDELLLFWRIANSNRGTANAMMIGISHVTSPEDLLAAAAWYSRQRPTSQKSHASKLSETGAQIYEKGNPSRGLPPCQTCHGREGRGSGAVPRVARQNKGYLQAQLALFRQSRRVNPAMTPIAAKLDDDDVRALAAYLHGQ